MVDKTWGNLELNEITSPHKGGRFRGVSIGLDKYGYFVCTHRARTKSYSSPEDISEAMIKFIASTG